MAKKLRSFSSHSTRSILPTLLLLTITINSTSSQFYMFRDASHRHKNTAEAICMGIDSQHTYLCTDTPNVSREALSMSPSQIASQDNIERLGVQKDYVNLGVNQRLSGSESEIKNVKEVLSEMIKYFDREVMSRSEYEHVRENCRNEHELCAFWTSVGECESNRVFMLQNCAAACRLCLLHATNMMGG